MTEKQRAFADEYLRDFNATRAYIAIYKPKSRHGAEASASRLLKNAEVKEYIDGRYSEEHGAIIAEGRELRRFLTRCVRGDISEVAIVQGDKVQKPISIRDRIKCAEMLIKITNMRETEPESDEGWFWQQFHL